MHISYQKLSFEIFMVENVQNIFMAHDLYLIFQRFLALKKKYNFEPYNVFLAIATNIPQRLNTGFVLQSHIYVNIKMYDHLF